MLDITRRCDAESHHNVTAMSECVVAESEARAELLQKWGRLPDASVAKCLKLAKTARRLPYSAIVKCLSGAPLETGAQVPAPTAPAPSPASEGTASSILSKLPSFSIPHF